ncbi:hypothetical protein TrRE_jg11421 [Triparma retinervis]|uniref:Uncharacterized protein n=1 Tax=Triparma retinervis TaxID=2557542 RepID=A0A9W7AL90_9STRA|nr:hypothetical protein TrRE_jg11421 [Triparma retinervis]
MKRTSEDELENIIEVLEPSNLDVVDDVSEVFEGSESDSAAEEAKEEKEEEEEAEEEEEEESFPLFFYRACEDDGEGAGYITPLALFCGAGESSFGEASIGSLWTNTVTKYLEGATLDSLLNGRKLTNDKNTNHAPIEKQLFSHEYYYSKYSNGGGYSSMLPLHFAIAANSPAIVKKMLEMMQEEDSGTLNEELLDPTDRCSIYGEHYAEGTPLHMALGSSGDLELISLLITLCPQALFRPLEYPEGCPTIPLFRVTSNYTDTDIRDFVSRKTNFWYLMDTKVDRCVSNLVASVRRRGLGDSLVGEAAAFYRVWGDFKARPDLCCFERIMAYASWGDMGEGLTSCNSGAIEGEEGYDSDGPKSWRFDADMVFVVDDFKDAADY